MKIARQSGNMLFILLIAIALLGALAAVLTRSSNTSEDTGSAEQASIVASQILKHASALQTATQSLLVRGCSENELSYEAVGTTQDPGHANAQAPADKSCHIFEPAGSGLKYISPQSFFPGLGPGGYNLVSARTAIADIGTAAGDLYWILEIHSDKATICKAINRALGFNESAPILGQISAGPAYDGTIPVLWAGAQGAINGRKSYCYELSVDPGRYFFYSVLIAR